MALPSKREKWQAWTASACTSAERGSRHGAERGVPRCRVTHASGSRCGPAPCFSTCRGAALCAEEGPFLPRHGVPSRAAWPVSLARPSESVTLAFPRVRPLTLGVVLLGFEPPAHGQSPLCFLAVAPWQRGPRGAGRLPVSVLVLG